MSQGINLGILGATGNVGIELLRLLENWDETKLPLANPPKLFGTSRSAGRKIKFRGQDIEVLESKAEHFDGLDLIISTANGEVSEHLVPEAIKRGVKLVIDTDSFYRMNEDVPLVVAGVNDHDIDNHKGIIAGPNCTTAQLIVPLKILDENFGIKRVVVSTYQAISGAGKSVMDQMVNDCAEILGDNPQPENIKRLHEDQIAFNLVPVISRLMDNGYSKEEMKVQMESRKMLGKPDLKLTCTAVRVPVLNCHSEAVNIELEKECSVEEIQNAIKQHPFVQLWSDWSEYPMPLDQSGTDPVHVGRIRRDESQANTFDMWVVADNLLIGAALNAIRVAESAYNRQKI